MRPMPALPPSVVAAAVSKSRRSTNSSSFSRPQFVNSRAFVELIYREYQSQWNSLAIQTIFLNKKIYLIRDKKHTSLFVAIFFLATTKLLNVCKILQLPLHEDDDEAVLLSLIDAYYFLCHFVQIPAVSSLKMLRKIANEIPRNLLILFLFPSLPPFIQSRVEISAGVPRLPLASQRRAVVCRAQQQIDSPLFSQKQ